MIAHAPSNYNDNKQNMGNIDRRKSYTIKKSRWRPKSNDACIVINRPHVTVNFSKIR